MIAYLILFDNQHSSWLSVVSELLVLPVGMLTGVKLDQKFGGSRR